VLLEVCQNREEDLPEAIQVGTTSAITQTPTASTVPVATGGSAFGQLLKRATDSGEARGTTKATDAVNSDAADPKDKIEAGLTANRSLLLALCPPLAASTLENAPRETAQAATHSNQPAAMVDSSSSSAEEAKGAVASNSDKARWSAQKQQARASQSPTEVNTAYAATASLNLLADRPAHHEITQPSAPDCVPHTEPPHEIQIPPVAAAATPSTVQIVGTDCADSSEHEPHTLAPQTPEKPRQACENTMHADRAAAVSDTGIKTSVKATMEAVLPPSSTLPISQETAPAPKPPVPSPPATALETSSNQNAPVTAPVRIFIVSPAPASDAKLSAPENEKEKPSSREVSPHTVARTAVKLQTPNSTDRENTVGPLLRSQSGSVVSATTKDANPFQPELEAPQAPPVCAINPTTPSASSPHEANFAANSSSQRSPVIHAGQTNPDPVVPPPAGGAVQAVRLLDRVGQTEMHIGLRSPVFGTVEVHTAVHGSEVGLAMGSERGDLRGWMAGEVPSLEGTLRQHDLRLDQVHYLEPALASSSGGFSQSNPHSRSSSQAFSVAARPADITVPTAATSTVENIYPARAGLDVRA
jgi:hypothetical protein